MNYLPLCAGVVAFLFASGSFGSSPDWRPITHLDSTLGGGPGAQLQYDAATTQRAGSRVTVWERVIYDSPKTIDGVEVSVMAVRYTYDCAAHVFSTNSIRAYNGTGKILYSTDTPDVPRPLVPSQVGFDYLALFCRKPARPNNSFKPKPLRGSA